MNRHVIASAVISLALLAGAQARAQEPVVGAADPDRLFTSPDPQLNRNKQAAYHIVKDLLEAGHWDEAGQWLTPEYHQHNPLAASGLAGGGLLLHQGAEGAADAGARQDEDGDRRRAGRGRLRDRGLSAEPARPQGPVQDLLDHLVRHVALQGRQGRRTLGPGDAAVGWG
ncbi:MAG: hypothetical protein WDM92_02860 [Caulobacteraceae bacterium]